MCRLHYECICLFVKYIFNGVIVCIVLYKGAGVLKVREGRKKKKLSDYEMTE